MACLKCRPTEEIDPPYFNVNSYNLDCKHYYSFITSFNCNQFDDGFSVSPLLYFIVVDGVHLAHNWDQW
jgi:hypothetical protein